MGTVTGRFSSSQPNMLGMPHRTEEAKIIRAAFLNGVRVTEVDYGPAEERLMILQKETE